MTRTSFLTFMYVSGHRSDVDTFVSLYEVTLTKALEISQYSDPLNHEPYTNLIRRQRVYVYHHCLRSVCKDIVRQKGHRDANVNKKSLNVLQMPPRMSLQVLTQPRPLGRRILFWQTGIGC